jgi:hypothetical protein
MADPPPPPEEAFVPGCYANPGPQVDFRYDGPIDTLENAVYMSGAAVNCVGPTTGTPFTIVRAPDQAAAIAKCVGLGLPSSASNFSAIGYPVPTDVWTCNDN